MMQPDAKIYVAGHQGMVGAALCRLLAKKGFRNIVVRTSAQLDLRNQQAVHTFFATEKPDVVFLAAAKVGGIHANNTYRAAFLYDNLMIEANVIHAAYLHQVQKLMLLGSSCIYPKMAAQPLQENQLLTGPLEPTNEPYAIAKIAGIKLCQSYRSQYNCNFISVLPTNLYGFGDNYHPENAHVLPALIRKLHLAKENNHAPVQVWGTGTPRREFLFVDDLAHACLFLMENYNQEQPINIGVGHDISIKELVSIIAAVVQYKGKVNWDTSMPDGTPRKLLDISKMTKLGWKSTTTLKQGIEKTYTDFLNRKEHYLA